ncbi:branched-chain amino acid ABC transporter permease [Rhodospirillaceae bacterium SYSU D60014]|uniref:branched-chain amino acid ABC transporter permease n=1 Tax=Virgifigura deserti TaxID=2268457 RepID=UPI000E675399
MAMRDTSEERASPGLLGPGLFVILLEALLALLLFLFLTSESWIVTVGLLAAAGAGFLWLQRNPEIETRITDWFAQARLVAIVVGGALAVAFPFFLGGDSYVLHLLIIAELYAVLALALNFQLGSANIPNFATGASYGIGAYASALLAIHFGIGFWGGLVASAMVATFFGFVLGVPSMRTRESYLALVTIAFGVVVHQVINNVTWTGGPNGLVGIPAPTLFGHSFAEPIEVLGFRLPSQANFYYTALALIGLSIVVARRLHHSRIGLAWNALRTDELAARCQGINVTWYKVLAFAVDAFMAAFAGTIYAFYIGYISPDNFTFLVSVTIMTMVIVGGMDNIFGVILGAFLLTVLPEKFRVFSDYRLLLYGVIVIGMLMVRPEGLFPKRLRRYGGHG